MTERVLDLRDFSLIDSPEQNDKLQSWLRFNGIDPHQVVQNSLMTVRDDYAEIVCFDPDREGYQNFANKNVNVFVIHTPMDEFGL